LKQGYRFGSSIRPKFSFTGDSHLEAVTLEAMKTTKLNASIAKAAQLDMSSQAATVGVL
jgi:hypothetical protein